VGHQAFIRSAALLGLCALVVLHPAGAAANAGSQLCPIATDRQKRSVGYRSSSNVIKAPVTAEDTVALLKILRSDYGEPRTIAIMRLALAGDLDAFRLLLTNTDIDGVYIYASNYLNRDGTVCIDAELERALLDRLHETELGHRLVALLGKNTYRNARVLRALLEVPFDPGQANHYLAFGRAITSTHLPHIEADVLEHARSLLPLESPVEKRVLPGLHQHYVQFFTARSYAPAVAYFRELLAQAERDEPLQYFQIQFGMLRTVVQRGLIALGGTEADAAIIGELETIADRPLDPFAMSELQNMSKLVSSMTETSARNAVVEAFERLLVTQQPAKFEYPMRRTIYRTLAELDTAKSKALLIAELARFAGNEPPPNRDAAIARLFDALTHATDLDIGGVLAVVGDLNSPFERRMVWSVARLHASDAAVDFLLAELRVSLSGGAEAEQLLGREASTALLNTLGALEMPEYQRRARDGIDALFDEGILDESDYVSIVTLWNEALGDESSRYVAFRAEQARERAARRQAAEEQGRRELRASFAGELVRHSSAQGIRQSVAMLSAHGGEGRRAAEWLIIVGEAALPQLHEALAAAQTSDRHRFQLMDVIGEIGSARSTAALIQAAQTWADGGLYRPALFALALIPPTAEAVAFANAQLASGVAERRQIAGLVYLAQIRHEPAGALVSQFTADDLSLKMRSAGWYLGARLGVSGIDAAVERALRQATDRSELEALLLSLAEAAESQEEFTRVAESVGFGERSYSYRQSLEYCGFRTAPDEHKVDFALQVMASGGRWQRREAIRYLIVTDPQGTVDRMTGGQGQFLPLHKLLPLSTDVQLLFSEGRRMGYRLQQTDRGYVLTEV
jgi:hypothetical protein